MRRLIFHLEVAFGKDEPDIEIHEIGSQGEVADLDDPAEAELDHRRPIGFAPRRQPKEK